MTTLECPWCEAPVEIDVSTAVDLACDSCLVRVELAPDPAPVFAAAA